MDITNLKISATRRPLWNGRGIEIRMVDVGPIIDGRARDKARVLTLPNSTEISDGEEIPPCFDFEEREAQLLVDALWELGIRPSNGEGSVGQLAATESHLKDLKTILFKSMKIEEENGKRRT